jgi:hypothetical protein
MEWMVMQPIDWTPEMDDLLFTHWNEWGPTRLAAELGVSRDAVRGRGRKIKAWESRDAGAGCHIAADPRSAELLRAAGVDI